MMLKFHFSLVTDDQDIKYLSFTFFMALLFYKFKKGVRCAVHTHTYIRLNNPRESLK